MAELAKIDWVGMLQVPITWINDSALQHLFAA